METFKSRICTPPLFWQLFQISLAVLRICENKDADLLGGDCEADQRLCFRYTESTIPLLPKSEISSLKLSSVAVQPGLCRTISETLKTGFLTKRLIYNCKAADWNMEPANGSGKPAHMCSLLHKASMLSHISWKQTNGLVKLHCGMHLRRIIE